MNDEQSKKIVDTLINYLWLKLLMRVDAGETYEEARDAIYKEILND